MENVALLKSAMGGDIQSFQSLFAGFQSQLKSYLYRLLADRNDTEDLLHDTFIKAFDKITTFREESSLKTWVFRIATNLAYDHLKKSKRWQPDAQDRGRDLALSSPEILEGNWKVHVTSNAGAYDIKEHIDFCFTCISKTLPVEKQVVLILKDIYDFSVHEIGLILEKTEGVVKHLLIDARKTMAEIFDHRCALINKNGMCHQCTEMNGIFNPKQNQQEELTKLELAKGSTKYNRDELYELRAQLVKAIDPLHSSGTDFHERIMRCTRTAIGEIDHL